MFDGRELRCKGCRKTENISFCPTPRRPWNGVFHRLCTFDEKPERERERERERVIDACLNFAQACKDHLQTLKDNFVELENGIFKRCRVCSLNRTLIFISKNAFTRKPTSVTEILVSNHIEKEVQDVGSTNVRIKSRSEAFVLFFFFSASEPKISEKTTASVKRDQNQKP